MLSSEIKSLLASRGIRPLKSRGQNFLIDAKVTEDLCDAAGISAGDRILEIGPGFGVLTETLLSRGATVVAVELDPTLASILRERLENKRLQVIEGDFLEQSMNNLVTALGCGEGEYKVAANLPYAITSDALSKLLTESPKPASVTLMLQREVAERACAEPPEVSMLSVLVGLFGNPTVARRVPASCFWPQPKVESAILHVPVLSAPQLKDRLRGLEPEQVLSVPREAFSERRKQIKNTLGRKFGGDRLESALKAAGIRPEERPERVTVEQWIDLSSALLR